MYDISEQQKTQLREAGYVRLPDALSPELLEQWRGIADKLEASALEAHSNGDRLAGACVIEDPVGPRLMRYDDLHAVETDASLDLLACPGMMAVARELCGEGTVPLQMDLLYKHQHPHPVIIWHQGAPHPRGYPYLNVGIYLDDADENDGCLRYIPGTQHELQDICGLAGEHGWDLPGVVEQPAKAGDILIQDMMILHGSQPKRTPGARRTIYVELRPATGILESGAQSEEWASLRQRWMGLVVRRAEKGEWPAEWRQHLPPDLDDDGTEIAAINARHEPPIPAVYCHYPVEHPEYPVPSEMRDES